MYIEMIAVKALRTFISIYPLLKIERLSVNTKLTLYTVLIRSIMSYACPTWEFAADSHLLKLQCLQKKVLCTVVDLPSCTLSHDLHMVYKIP
jgi:hypothetical protein